jgi:hypothetical protein
VARRGPPWAVHPAEAAEPAAHRQEAPAPADSAARAVRQQVVAAAARAGAPERVAAAARAARRRVAAAAVLADRRQEAPAPADAAAAAASANVTGSGSHRVVVETNSAAGINEGTIFRPMDLGGAEKYPIFVWAQGACSQNGLSASAAMAEIASHGYFVVADGKPNGSGSRSMTSDYPAMAKPLLAYITWAIAENDKPCSAYYQSLDAAKVAANGFSCGGLMAAGTAGDPRITTWGITSSGTLSANQAYYRMVHTPVLIVLGGQSDVAYPNGQRDFTNIAPLGFPILLFSKDIGHGGDLFSSRGGDFTKINLAWLNWQLKGDTGATGKGFLVGSGCTFCSNSAWEYKSMNVQ